MIGMDRQDKRRAGATARFRKLAASVPLALLALSGGAVAGTLREAVQASLYYHPQLLEAGARADAARHGIGEARAGYLPQLDLSGGVGYQWTENPSSRARGVGSTGLPARDVSLIARQLVFDGFGTPGRIDQAHAAAGSARWQFLSSGEQVALRAVQVYLDVLRHMEFVRLAEENVRDHRDIVTNIRRRALGPSAGADAVQAESRMQLAIANLETRRGDLESAKVRFLEVVGEAARDLQAPLRAEQVIVPEISGALALAEDNSPAVRASGRQVEAAEASVTVARSPFYPRFDVEVGGTASDDVSGVRGRNLEAHARLLMRYNLISGGSDLARSRRAESELSAAKLAEAEQKRAVRENVRVAIEDLRTSRARLEPLGRHRQTVSEVLESYKSQFDIGRRSLLDVLDVTNEKFNSRVNYHDEEVRLLLTYYQLLAVSGQLLANLYVKVPEPLQE